MDSPLLFVLLLLVGVQRCEPSLSDETGFLPKTMVRELKRIVEASIVEEIQKRLETELKGTGDDELTDEIQNIRRNITDGEAVCNVTAQHYWELCRPLFLRTCKKRYRTDCRTFQARNFPAFRRKLGRHFPRSPPPKRSISRPKPILEWFEDEISRLNDSTMMFRESDADRARRTKAQIALDQLREKYPNISPNSSLVNHRLKKLFSQKLAPNDREDESDGGENEEGPTETVGIGDSNQVEIPEERSPPPRGRDYDPSLVAPRRANRKRKRRKGLSRRRRTPRRFSYRTRTRPQPMMRNIKPYMVPQPRIENWAKTMNWMKEIEQSRKIMKEFEENRRFFDQIAEENHQHIEALGNHKNTDANGIRTYHIPQIQPTNRPSFHPTNANRIGTSRIPRIRPTNQPSYRPFHRYHRYHRYHTTTQPITETTSLEEDDSDSNTADIRKCRKIEQNPHLCLENFEGERKCGRHLENVCPEYVVKRSRIKKDLDDLRLKQHRIRASGASQDDEINETYKWATLLVSNKRPIIIRSIKAVRGVAYVTYRLSDEKLFIMEPIFEFNSEDSQSLGQAIRKMILGI